MIKDKYRHNFNEDFARREILELGYDIVFEKNQLLQMKQVKNTRTSLIKMKRYMAIEFMQNEHNKINHNLKKSMDTFKL